MKPFNKQFWANAIGAAGTSICIIHCIATPALVALGGSFLNNKGITYAFLLIAFFSIYKATEHNYKTKTCAFLWLSFTLYALCLLFEEWYNWLHYAGYFTGICIVAAHIYNIKNCPHCND